ncbi:MAG: N-acetyl-gamma-glutamyl-phosphate reductase [Myxococcota bacterium]|nr:N-acetyl-gamma-glutamyl-phosphate reductase [Myxococcota bacterium]
MKPRIFLDGSVGTTGLRIREFLERRRDVVITTLTEPERKDSAARRAAVRAANVAVLCLPDDAAREAAAWAEDTAVRLLDASTAHRIAEGWIYGLPELAPGQRDAIRGAKRVSNPGCYPTAFLLLVRPLLDAGLLAPDAPLTLHALSGYSGGGKPLIGKWEDPSNGLLELPYEAPYTLGARHKHIPEMLCWSGLTTEPQFVPAVGPFRCGMRVEVPLPAALLRGGADAKALWEALHGRYDSEPYVRVLPLTDAAALHERSFDPRACNDTNRIDLHVVPNAAGHVLLIAILDNLGKGAAGAAVQNLELMLGLEPA